MSEVTRRRVLVSATSLAALNALHPVRSFASAMGVNGGDEDWDLTDLYESDTQWENVRQTTLQAVPTLARYKGTLSRSAGSLQAAYTAASNLRRTAERLGVYAQAKADGDLRSTSAQNMRQLANDLSDKLDGATAWMAPEVLAIGRTRIENFLKSDPALAPFRFKLQDTLRVAPHTLSAEGEALLAQAAAPLDAPSAIARVLLNSDIPRAQSAPPAGAATGSPEIPQSERRRLADQASYNHLSMFEESLGQTLNASLLKDVFEARARRFNTSLEAALFTTNVPPAVYKTLIAEVNRGLPALHDYYDLQRQALKVPQAHVYELGKPFGTYRHSFTLSEIRTLTLAAVTPLGKPYVDTLARATAARWMDPLPRPDKVSGSITNSGAYDVHPYVLLNLGKGYPSLTLYAHEWGHAMHNVLARDAQPFDTFSAPVFLQEIASTCNELLLAKHLVKQSKSNQEKLYYLEQQLRLLQVVFFEQAMLAEFEGKLHELIEAGQALSGEQISKLYLELMARYHGPSVTIDPFYAIQWVEYPQFYNAFYLYQYSTAIAAGAQFATSILEGGAEERDRYLTMLKSGGSDYGYQTLVKAGVNLADPAPYRNLVALFSATLEQVNMLRAEERGTAGD